VKLTRGVGLAALLLVAGLLVHLPALVQHHDPFNSDEAYLATQAQVLQHGGALYYDTVDRKPPVVPLLYAGVFEVTGSDSLISIRVLAILAEVVAGFLLAIEARRRFDDDRAAPIAGLLFVASTGAFFAKDVQTANFEVFMLPAAVGAFTLATRNRFAGAGVAAAAATMCQQIGATVLLPLAFLAWRSKRRGRAFAVLAAGFVVPIAICALAFGFGTFTHWVFTSNGGYLDASGVWGYVARLGLRQTWYFMLAHLALVVLALVGARRAREHVDVWLWLLAGAIAVGSGLRFFGHYYLILLAPLSLLATLPLLRARWHVLLAVGVSIVATVAFFAWPAFTYKPSHTVVVGEDLARYAREHTQPGDRVLVWGHLPEVYWRSGVEPATRFATTGFLTGLSGGRPSWRTGMQYAAPGAWTAFDHDLAAHPPALVFDLSPSNVRDQGHSPPTKFPRFGDVLARDYHQIEEVDGVPVYARR
jgi:MFS family permease